MTLNYSIYNSIWVIYFFKPPSDVYSIFVCLESVGSLYSDALTHFSKHIMKDKEYKADYQGVFGEFVKEKDMQKQLFEYLEKNLKNYSVKSNYSLPYKSRRIHPKHTKDRSYKTDISIWEKKENGKPLVILELKVGSGNTHDIIAYSHKALTHKIDYPYLRYGYVTNRAYLEPKNFWHGEGFDFIIALNGFKKPGKLLETIKRQISSAKKFSRLSHLSSRKDKFTLYNSTLEVRF